MNVNDLIEMLEKVHDKECEVFAVTNSTNPISYGDKVQGVVSINMEKKSEFASSVCIITE